MNQVQARTTTPGARVVPTVVLSDKPASSRTLRVRAGRTTTWRGKFYPADTLQIDVTGRLLAIPTGEPIVGLPVCSLTVSRFTPTRRCATSNSNGRYTVRVRPNEQPLDNQWELLEFGDSTRNLPWRTTVLQVHQIVTTPTVLVEPRGYTTGTVTDTNGAPVAGQRVCAVPKQDTGAGSYLWLPDHKWCVDSDATGQYALRVNGGERLWWPQAPTTQQYLNEMDPYLTSGAFIDDRVGGWTRWDIGMPIEAYGQSSVVDLFAAPGYQLNVTITPLVPGPEITVTGVATGSGSRGTVPAVGTRVCGFTRAGFVCTDADADGRYTLTLPTRVTPDNPTAEVRVRVVAGSISSSDAPSVARFAAAPGSQHTVPLAPGFNP